MNIYNIFPVTIFQTEYENSKEFNEMCLNTLPDYVNKEGKTGEAVFNKLHHLENFSHFYTFVSKCILSYLEMMQIDTQGMTVNVTKSWFECKKETTLAPHTHGDCHYSFVYYVNNPEEIRKDIFFIHPNFDHHYNEPHAGFFKWSRKTHSDENCETYAFPSSVGTLYVFPSKLRHGTTGIFDPNYTTSSGIFSVADAMNSRVCISGDVIMTISDEKTKEYHHLGLKSVDNWKRFE